MWIDHTTTQIIEEDKSNNQYTLLQGPGSFQTTQCFSQPTSFEFIGANDWRICIHDHLRTYAESYFSFPDSCMMSHGHYRAITDLPFPPNATVLLHLDPRYELMTWDYTGCSNAYVSGSNTKSVYIVVKTTSSDCLLRVRQIQTQDEYNHLKTQLQADDASSSLEQQEE